MSSPFFMLMPSGRRVVVFFKIALVALFGGLLAYELGRGDQLNIIWAAFRAQRGHANAGWLLAVLALLPVNWLLETQKWRLLLHSFMSVGWAQSLRGVLAGVSLAVFTPNRLGEYGGRVLFIRPRHRWQAVAANIVSTLSQAVVVVAAGSAGLLWFVQHHLQPAAFYLYAVAMVALASVAVLLFCYFHIRLLTLVLRRAKWLRRIRPLMRGAGVLGRFSQRTLAKVLGCAALRYWVYSVQYFFLLNYFGIKTGILGGFAGISTLFLLQTGIPLPPVMGLVARGSLAVQVWAQFGANEISSLAATFLLWIINLILPALVGTFFLLNVQGEEIQNNEKD